MIGTKRLAHEMSRTRVVISSRDGERSRSRGGGTWGWGHVRGRGRDERREAETGRSRNTSELGGLGWDGLGWVGKGGTGPALIPCSRWRWRMEMEPSHVARDACTHHLRSMSSGRLNKKGGRLLPRQDPTQHPGRG